MQEKYGRKNVKKVKEGERNRKLKIKGSKGKRGGR